MTNAERADALARFQVLRPHLEDGVSLQDIARQQGIHLRTARRWVSQYRAAGLAGLGRKGRSDRGKRRKRGLTTLYPLIEAGGMLA
jgi:putative transposase